MRIIQLCLSKSWGGLEMSALRYAEVMSELGHESECVCLLESPLESALQKSSVRSKSLRPFKKIWPLSAVFELRSFLKERRTSLVFVHHLKDLFILAPALIGLKEIKVAGLSHVLLKRPKKDFFHRLLYSTLDRMIVFTEIQRDLSLSTLPVAADRYAILPGFVDVKVFNPEKRSEDLRLSLGVKPDELLIGAIGRLDEQKGQAEFLESLAFLRSSDPELKWKAVLIGAVTAAEEKKGYALYVERQLIELRLEDRVQLLGFLPDPSSAMASLDIFVLPSYKETFGLVILEAMASQVVPVVTDTGGPPEIVGGTGVTVPPKDRASLARELAHLLKHPELRAELSRKALSRVRATYSREVVRASLQRFTEELVR